MARWGRAKLTRANQFKPVAARLAAPAAKLRYLAVEKATGVPWPFIAVTHQRESNQNWERSLAQGDPWNRKSTHVPKGRGPFKSWEDAAYDALMNCAPYAGKNKDWSIGGTLTMLERYNGVGYANKSLPSPYVWSGTDQYARGKYIRDGVFDANTVDVQLGCAGLLLAMQAVDPSVNLGGKVMPPAPKVTPEAATGGGIAVGGAAAAQQAAAYGLSLWMVAAIVVAVVAVAIVAFVLIKRSSEKAPPFEPPSKAGPEKEFNEAEGEK